MSIPGTTLPEAKTDEHRTHIESFWEGLCKLSRRRPRTRAEAEVLYLLLAKPFLTDGDP